MPSYVHINIPLYLYKTLEDLSMEEGCKNVEEFMMNDIRKKVAKYNAEKDGYELSDEDEERIKKRLRELGYMD